MWTLSIIFAIVCGRCSQLRAETFTGPPNLPRRFHESRVLPDVRRLLCEFAQAAARTRCALKAKFDALTIRKGHKKSVVALAHKMLRTIYAMLTNGSHYQDKEVDYEALNVQRNAPRWIKMLRKHGFIATPAAA